jgi:large subunit ribosomal protein L31e
MAEEERIYTIPLRIAKSVPRGKRTPRAIKFIKSYIARHMKANDEDIWIDPRLNEALWSRGIQKVPPKIRVRAVKFEDDLVEVSLPEE